MVVRKKPLIVIIMKTRVVVAVIRRATARLSVEVELAVLLREGFLELVVHLIVIGLQDDLRMSTAALVTLQSGLRDGHRIDDHVAQLADEHRFLVYRSAVIRKHWDVVPALEIS